MLEIKFVVIKNDGTADIHFNDKSYTNVKDVYYFTTEVENYDTNRSKDTAHESIQHT